MNDLTTRVLIVSSNTFVRLGLRRTFEAQPGVVIVGECSWGASACHLVAQERPDLIVLDLEFDMKQEDVISMLRQSAPLARIVLLTGWADIDRGRKAMEIGADVIMMKCQPASILLALIQTLGKNHEESTSAASSLALKPEHRDKMPQGKAVPVPGPNMALLTDRERAVVALVGQGLTNRDIAERLYISETTVRHHLTSIFNKLGVSNRQKLLILAHQCGLTDIRTSA